MFNAIIDRIFHKLYRLDSVLIFNIKYLCYKLILILEIKEIKYFFLIFCTAFLMLITIKLIEFRNTNINGNNNSNFIIYS